MICRLQGVLSLRALSESSQLNRASPAETIQEFGVIQGWRQGNAASGKGRLKKIGGQLKESELL